MTKQDKDKEKELQKEEQAEQEKQVQKPAKGKAKAKPKKSKQESKEIIALKEQVDSLNDRYLRLFSEFDNYRKRTLKEKIELGKTASEDVIISILPVLDDFERALSSFEEMDVNESFKEGVLLIFNKFLTLLQQKGLETIDSIGEEFDTDFHEAVTNIPAPSEEMKGKVADEIEKGYKLNDKVIRYAKVVVGN
ncbi:MAG: nucleotide exchange factor GrpE [Bacteroidota bacterium]|nr:nucleotide exchange factor GrpE [Bacteroidota bacterium]